MLSEFLTTLINGMITGLGMIIIMTPISILTFKILEKYITKKLGNIWKNIRGSHVDMSGSIDFKQQHKEWDNE